MSQDKAFDQEPVVHRSWNHMPEIDRGEGIYLYDKEGNRYIDGAAGSSVVVNIGHGVQSVIDAMYEQGKKVSFAAPHVFTNEPVLKLGRVVSERAPGSLRGNCRTWFSCTGTGSVDDAVRLARQYSVSIGKASKYLIIGRWQGFHGNGISAAGFHGHTFRRRIYFPMFVNNPHIPPAYCYRCPFELSHPGCRLKCARALETEIRRHGEENVAAFIAEPVVGAALGSVPPPDGYFEVIREICDRYQVLFICDEVMTGWGRTGHWFGIEEWGVTPDIIATAKGMSSGYTPIAATIARKELWQAVEDSGLPFLAGHTLNQNPVSCAGALAAIDYVESHKLLDNTREVGAYLLGRMEELLEFDIIGDVRGKGLLLGFEFVKDKETKEPFDPSLNVSALYQEEAFRRGLIQYACTGCVEGVAGDMNLVTPPLTISREQVDEMVEIMKASGGCDSTTATQGLTEGLMHYHSEELIRDLSGKAQDFRIQVLKMIFNAQTGHLGGSFSIAETLTSLYFHHLRMDPSNPDWPERDRLLFSKGHACPMLYTVMAHRGFFPVEELSTFRQLDSRLQGHPDRAKLPGIEICAGPLGHGVAIGAGMAWASKKGVSKPSSFSAPSARASRSRVYVVLGDGELNAGVIWEGAMTAAKYRLGNLTAVVDYNGIQQTGASVDVMPTEPIVAKWQAFNWHVQEIDGHNVAEILGALDRADEVHARPSVIIARTTKGKGVSTFEYDHRWHGAPPNEEQYEHALAELKEGAEDGRIDFNAPRVRKSAGGIG